MNRTLRPLFLLLIATLALSLTGCPDSGREGADAGGRHRLGVTANRYIPNSWQVPAWFIDPSNSTGNASDSNNGTSTATPFLTWHHLNDEVWGCASAGGGGCPRLQQSTAIEFLSSHPDNTDPVYFYPAIENGAVIQIFGPLGAAQQIASGVLSNVTAKNRATPQLLLAQSGATAVGQFVVNSTHPSRAWTYAVSSGAIYKMTQPEAAVVVPSFPTTCGAEVDTWANGDSVVIYQPVKVNIVSVRATISDLNGGFSNYVVYLYNLAIADFGSSDPASLNSTSLWESLTARPVNITGPTTVSQYAQCNSFASQVVSTFCGGTQGSPFILFDAGALAGSQVSLTNAGLKNDVILGGSAFVGSTYSGGGASSVGVYVESGKVANMTGIFNASSTIWWGPGTLNVTGSGRFIYTSTASANLLIALQLNGGTTGHSVNTASNVDTPCGGITVNKANLDTAVSATCSTTGFGGLAFNQGGASITTGTP